MLAATPIPKPDPYVPGHIVHVNVSYSAILKDQYGGTWVCYYPVGKPDSCVKPLNV